MKELLVTAALAAVFLLLYKTVIVPIVEFFLPELRRARHAQKHK